MTQLKTFVAYRGDSFCFPQLKTGDAQWRYLELGPLLDAAQLRSTDLAVVGDRRVIPARSIVAYGCSSLFNDSREIDDLDEYYKSYSSDI